MREIKFRAWDRKAKRMLRTSEVLHSFDYVMSMRDVYEVMQYTGLKDKNGIEIYESDCIDKKYNAIVVFWRAGFWVDHIHGEIRKKTSLSDWLFGRDRALVGSEIIGNIHQHPHLLEKTKS